MLCFHLIFITQLYTTKSMVLEATLCQPNVPPKLSLGLHCHRLRVETWPQWWRQG